MYKKIKVSKKIYSDAIHYIYNFNDGYGISIIEFLPQGNNKESFYSLAAVEFEDERNYKLSFGDASVYKEKLPTTLKFILEEDLSMSQREKVHLLKKIKESLQL